MTTNSVFRKNNGFSVFSSGSGMKMILIFFCIVFFCLSVIGQTKNTSIPLFFEKVYIHTDRDYYAAGDDLWFAAYLVNGKSNVLMGTSNNLYVQLISPGEKPEIVAREVIRVDSGLGHGDFHLSDSLVSGTYRLRAYTNWMRNFGDNFIFEKNIYIAGTKEIAKGTQNDSAKKRKDEILFFPEGGTMVDGVTGVVAFKAVDANGKGVDVTGFVVSSLGDTVCPFKSEHLGMGKFSLLPLPGVAYTAVGKFRNKITFAKDLPFAAPNGFAMQLVVRDTNGVLVNIATNEETLGQYTNSSFTLKALNHGKTVFGFEVPVHQAQTILRIPGSYFPAGVTALTLHDPQGRPQCERLVYVSSCDSVSIEVTTDKFQYQAGDCLQVTLRLKNAPEGSTAHLSLALVDARTVPDGVSNIVSYLDLESEVKGFIEKPGTYFDTSNLNRLKQLDLLLLTQGWRSFVWRRMKDTSLVIKYAPEAGFTISGRVRQRLLNKPVVNTNLTMQLAGGGKNALQGTLTDSLGHFYFNGLEFYGTKKLTLTSKNINNKAWGWILMDSLYWPIRIPVYKQFEVDSINQKISEDLFSIKKRKRKFSLTDTIELPEFVVKQKSNQISYNYGTYSIVKEREFKVNPEDSDYYNLEMYLFNVAPDLTPRRSDLKHEQWAEFNAHSEDPSNINLPKIKYRVIYGPDLNDEKKLKDTINWGGRIPPIELPMSKIDKIIIKQVATLEEFSQWDKDSYFVCVYPKPGVSLSRPEFYRLIEPVTGYYAARTFYALQNKPKPMDKVAPATILYWNPNMLIKQNAIGKFTFYNNTIGNYKLGIQGVLENGVVVMNKTTFKLLSKD